MAPVWQAEGLWSTKPHSLAVAAENIRRSKRARGGAKGLGFARSRLGISGERYHFLLWDSVFGM